MNFKIKRMEEVLIEIGGIPRNTRVQIYATPEGFVDASELLPDHVTFQMSHEQAQKMHVGDEIQISIKLLTKPKGEGPVSE